MMRTVSPSSRSSVSGLLLGSSPSTVFRFVVSGVIDPVHATTNGTLSHVCKKVAETTPSRAYRYSSSPIIFPSGVFGIAAALDHGSPRAVGGRFYGVEGVTVDCFSERSNFSTEASTTTSSSLFKIARLRGYFGSTIAQAIPHSISMSAGSARDCNESSESDSRKISGGSHMGSNIPHNSWFEEVA